MLKFILETPLDLLLVCPLSIPQALYSMVAEEIKQKVLTPGLHGSNWQILQQSCPLHDVQHRPFRHGLLMHTAKSRLLYECHADVGFCCTVHDGTQTLFVLRLVLVPFHHIVPEKLVKPYLDNANTSIMFIEDDLPYSTTVQVAKTSAVEVILDVPITSTDAQTFYELLYGKCPLPVLSDACSKCLQTFKSDCNMCGKKCACFCRWICNQSKGWNAPSFSFPMTTFYVTPPIYAWDPQHLIPRIVHQTFSKQPSRDQVKYPNRSRLVQSFRKSGWDYHFYNDTDIVAFFSTHFPPVVLEAYHALIPGAFKADLFRYCVLLIHGGVYADVDILLEAPLDFSIPPDVGFLVPVDKVSVTQLE